MVWNKIYHCGPTKNHSLLFNLYFSKKTSSITDLKGNITFLIPFDDTLTVSTYLMINLVFVWYSENSII